MAIRLLLAEDVRPLLAETFDARHVGELRRSGFGDIARGPFKPKAHDPKVWFTSTESFARALSNKNRALLAVIAATHPTSLQELAARTGRKTSNLSHTLKTMERYGLVRLHHGERGRARPEMPYQAISLELAFRA